MKNKKFLVLFLMEVEQKCCTTPVKNNNRFKTFTQLQKIQSTLSIVKQNNDEHYFFLSHSHHLIYL